MSAISIFPVAQGLEGWTEDLDREIIKYLLHTGSLACVCKTSERVCLVMDTGYHPADAKLLPWYRVEELEDEEELTHVAPRFRLIGGIDSSRGSDEEKPTNGSGYKGYWRWSCCGEDIGCTGCQAVCDL